MRIKIGKGKGVSKTLHLHKQAVVRKLLILGEGLTGFIILRWWWNIVSPVHLTPWCTRPASRDPQWSQNVGLLYVWTLNLWGSINYKHKNNNKRHVLYASNKMSSKQEVLRKKKQGTKKSMGKTILRGFKCCPIAKRHWCNNIFARHHNLLADNQNRWNGLEKHALDMYIQASGKRH